ncbi:WD repeat-containing protein 89 [Cephus cinctus]|uniref:WD repeat-containing protein 89 n=1 Tax=Cephus cinctus TaxID=211228 RepID=A0AAJ7BTB9_CEPCN|nr:WD repeat-containing protein 89 [Cephus cinctus]
MTQEIQTMSKIIEPLKKLCVNKRLRYHENERMALNNNKELTITLEESLHKLSDENYILSVCGTQTDPEFRIGVALSNYMCIVYSVGEALTQVATLNHNQASIVGIKFSPTSRNIFYVASRNGFVTACDLRARGKVVMEFKDSTEDGKIKPLASFDLNCNERLLAGGTEHIGGDAFILFWDIRMGNIKCDRTSLLGGYWESHLEDVTCLTFHPNQSDVLASGSTDGLINIFDISQSTEDSALNYSLNTESSVDRIGWLDKGNLWCTTHTHSLQLWECDAATPHLRFDRKYFGLSQHEDPDNQYVVRMHKSDVLGEKPFLLAGSCSAKGSTLRCMAVVENHLETLYDMPGNKQLVRDSWMHEKSGCLVTGGENALINVWRQVELSSTSRDRSDQKLLQKMSTSKIREKLHRPKPY